MQPHNPTTPPPLQRFSPVIHTFYRWLTLWSGPTQCTDEAVSQRFSPPLNKVNFPTKYVNTFDFNFFSFSCFCIVYCDLNLIQSSAVIILNWMVLNCMVTSKRVSATIDTGTFNATASKTYMYVWYKHKNLRMEM